MPHMYCVGFSFVRQDYMASNQGREFRFRTGSVFILAPDMKSALKGARKDIGEVPNYREVDHQITRITFLWLIKNYIRCWFVMLQQKEL